MAAHLPSSQHVECASPLSAAGPWRRVLAEGRWQLQLALDGGPGGDEAAPGRERVLGFANWGPLRDEGAGPLDGELHALYLASSHWGCGLSDVLMQSALSGLAQSGFQRAALWVLAGNSRARAFYARWGFVDEPGRVRSLELGGVRVDELRMTRRLGAPA